MEATSFPLLFRRAQEGDELAQEALYQLALRLALSAARKRLAPYDRALLQSQDIRQSVLIRFHHRLPDLSFDCERDLAAWLGEATKRLLQEKRRNALRVKRDVRRNVPYPTAGVPKVAAQSVRKALTRIAVEESLDQLPEETAEAVRLHALEGRTFGEVAEILGLTGADAARKRYARALVKLSSILGPDSGL